MFALETGYDECCPKEVAEQYWGPKGHAEYCVPNIKVDYEDSQMRAVMADKQEVMLKLGRIKQLQYECPYVERNEDCDPFTYHPENMPSGAQLENFIETFNPEGGGGK